MQAQSPAPALFSDSVGVEARALAVDEKDPVQVLRSRGVGLQKSAVRALASGDADVMDSQTAIPVVQLNLFPDTQIPMRVERREPTHDGVGVVIHGFAGTTGEDRVILTVYEGAMSGSVRLSNGEFYDVFVKPSGEGEIRQVRFEGNPDGADDYIIPEEDQNGLVRHAKASRLKVPADFQATGDMANYSGNPTIVDLLIAYTVRTRDARGGTAGVLAHINTIVAESNASFSNSQVNLQLRLVHAAEVAYDDSLSNMSYNTALSALRQTSDGAMDEVHTLRNQYGADVVGLLVSHPFSGGTVGMAYMCTSSPASFAPWAFSVTHQGYAGGIYLSFAHEVGHNLGLNHDPANGGSGGGLHTYSKGYQQKTLSPTFYTVMAYSSGCSGCTPVANFSNPRVTYSGIPMGVTNDIDAAATLDFMAPFAAAWRSAPAQSCSYNASPTSVSTGAGTGTSSVSVTTTSGCAWTATSNASWITVTSGSSGTGNGSATLSFAANPNATSRSGTATVAGRTVTVTQAAAAACSYTLSATSLSTSNTGGSGSVNVTSTSGCAWNAGSNAAWITVSAGASGSGSGTVSLSFAANPNTTSRTGTVTIAGQTVTVTQAAAPCVYTLSATSLSTSNAGGSGAVNVTSTSGCSWNAGSNAAWITVSAGASGSGSGTVSLSFAANPNTTSRTGTVTIAGQTVTVTQPGTPAPIVCSYTVTPTSISMPSNGGGSNVSIVADGACSWSASSQAGWVGISSATGTGNGTLALTVAANSTTSSRTGTLTVAGQAVTITQAGQTVLPVLTLSQSQLTMNGSSNSEVPTQSTVGVSTGSASLTYSVGGSIPTWLVVSNASGSTPGSLGISASPTNLNPGTYSATILVSSSGTSNGQASLQVTFTVTSPVTIRATPTALSFKLTTASAETTQTARLWPSNKNVSLGFQKSAANWLSFSATEGNANWLLNVRANPVGLPAGTYDASITVACHSASCSNFTIPVRMEVTSATSSDNQRKAKLASGGVVSAASYEQGVSEGSWVSIFGENLAEAARVWSIGDFTGNRMPTTLDGVRVRVDGKPAPIHYISGGQVNIQIPAGVRPGWVRLEIEGPFGKDESFVYSAAQTPGLFQFDNNGQVAAITPEGKPVMRRTAEAPPNSEAARPGQVISIFGTGFGPTSPRVEPGFVFSGAANLVAQGAVEVTIGGKPAKVHFAGLSGAGLNQLNVEVPSLPAGDHMVELVINGIPAQFGGKLAVQ
ncbi:MAG: hypothetical protein KIT83_06155 [Bryobacterales bacterium]|nr:hypothetical protein [Bryobacterales bacterium]